MNRHDPHPAIDDLDADVNLGPGFADIAHPIDPAEQVEAVNEFKRRLRDATPVNTTFPNHGGDEL